mgnify:CR=1 FL=1
MEIASKYNPVEVEGKWYQYWLDNGFFKSKPDGREPYTIVIPPPNVTGVLHMGHMLNNTIQDILIRRARMQGKNACWVPGTDHASIATEAKVVNRLAQQGIKKTDLTREDFLKHAWEWKEEHGASFHIQMDGGIGSGNASLCTQAGANVLVAGSSTFKASDMAMAINELRHRY